MSSNRNAKENYHDINDTFYFSYINGTGGYGVGRIVDNGFLIMKGSYISDHLSTYLPSGIKKARQQYEKFLDDNRLLTQDIVLSSPTYAADFIAGRSFAGPRAWRNAEGKSLKSICDERKIESEL